MTKIWVGMIASAFIALTMLGSGASAPHPDLMIDDFRNGGAQGWEAVNGGLTFEDRWSGAGDPLTLLVLEDNGGTGFVRARALASEVNTTLDSYMIHGILERDAGFGTPKAIGLTFGESPSGHYAVAFRDSFFALGVPDGSGGTSWAHTQPDWGTVPAWVSGVDDRHRYSVLVAGTTLSVKIDGWELGSFTLPGVPAGTYGIMAGDDTRVYSEQIVFGPLDTQGPSIALVNPEDSYLYIADEGIPIPATGFIAASGPLTVSANLTDDVSGVRVAHIYIDDRLVSSSVADEPDALVSWVLDLTTLSPGFHTVRVDARDWAGNLGSNETSIFVFGIGEPDEHTVDTATTMAADTVGLLPL